MVISSLLGINLKTIPFYQQTKNQIRISNLVLSDFLGRACLWYLQ
ncbi:hypothetical protein [Moraxella lacunata]